MKTLKTSTLWTSLCCIFFIAAVSCQSPAKLVEKQKYDKALDRVIKKIKKGKRIDRELRYALEDAYSSSTARDMSYIESMKKKDRIDNWDLIYDRANIIQSRQNKIQPYLPIYDESGSKAIFSFVKTQVIKDLASEHATKKYYQLANQQLLEGMSGDKMSARRAHEYFTRMNRYKHSFKDVKALKSQARELGTTYVLFEVENNSFNYVPRRVEDQIANRLSRNLSNRTWVKFDQNKNRRNYDYRIAYEIGRFNVSPDNYRETFIQEQKVIEDRYYKKDGRGNYVLDQNGDKIEIVTTETVRATVIKVVQSKEALIAGDLRVMDLQRNRIIEDRPIIVEKAFVKESCTFTGDERALTGNLPNLGSPVSFPRADELMLEAVKELEQIFSQNLDRINLI